jgi:nitrous oxidase accessory protein
MRAVSLVAAAAALPISANSASGQAITVGPGADFATIAEAVRSAQPGDTVRVTAGLYRERIQVTVPLTLRGEGWPVVDGGGDGHVVEVLAPLRLEGFVIRGSGDGVEEEHAGVMVRDAPGTRIEGNRLEDVFYGVYLKNSPGSLVSRNAITGKPFTPPRRGDGIRLWYSSGSGILENVVIGTRDVVIYFSDSLLVRGNVIEDGRYGLHYMYSNHNVFERNRFDGNEVGAFLMYSVGIRLRGNVFANAAGLTGMGIGLKDSDLIEASGNLIVGNVIGIHLDNSPHSLESTNRFDDNLLLANDAGVRLLPSVTGNVFEHNEFVNNGSPVIVAGGSDTGQAARNLWRANYWSEYAGFDQDGDAEGDTPFVHARLADDLIGRHPALGLFDRSPALGVLEVISRFFPLLKPEPVVVDEAPLVRGRLLSRWVAETNGPSSDPAARSRVAGSPRPAGPTTWQSAAWLLLALGAIGVLWRAAGRRGA